MSLFSKIKQGLEKTRAGMSNMFGNLFKSDEKVDDDFFDELTDALILSDVGAALSEEIVEKLRDTLKDLAETFGPERRIALCRELTKLHEEVRRTTLGEAEEYYRENPPKGEFVLVLAGAEPAQTEDCTIEEGFALVEKLRGEGHSTRDAVKEAASVCKLSRKALYDFVISREEE